MLLLAPLLRSPAHMSGLSSAVNTGVMALLVASTFAACGGGGDADATGPPVDADAPLDASVADAGREDCTNGVDDNGDGEIDCADPQCTPDYECVPTVPTDWTGYFRVNTAANPSAHVPCPDGGAPTTTFESPAGAAQCTACTCDSLTGATCDPPPLRCFVGSNNCSSGGGSDWTPALADGACHKPSNLLGATLRSRASCRGRRASPMRGAARRRPSISTTSRPSPRRLTRAFSPRPAADAARAVPACLGRRRPTPQPPA